MLYVERLCVLGLQADGDHPLLQHAAASLYELIASFVAKFDLPFILFPNRAIVYRLLGSADVTAVSRMCGILLQYKSEVESLKKRKEQSDAVVRVRQLLCLFGRRELRCVLQLLL